jgi:hypothetical protein
VSEREEGDVRLSESLWKVESVRRIMEEWGRLRREVIGRRGRIQGMYKRV